MYCSVCGSRDVVKAVVHTSGRRGGEFRPAISVGEVSAEAGSLHSESNTSLTYDAWLCLVCRNVVNQETANKQPILVSMRSQGLVIVIPYFLAMALRTKDEAKKFASRYLKCFEKIFRGWLKTAQNKCKGCRVGVKTTLAVRNIKINCWVIIEQGDAYHIRLSYGGAKIICP